MVSKALCLALPMAGAALAAATQTAPSQPAAGASPYGGPGLVTLTAVGLCVLAVWVVRSVARPGRLLLHHTPARANRLGPAHVVGVLVCMWVATRAAYEVLRPVLVDAGAGDGAAKAAEGRCQVAAGAIGAAVWLGLGLLAAAWTFRRGLRRGLGLSARRWLWDSVRGVLAYLAVWPVCLGLVLAMVALFRKVGIPEQLHPVLKALPTFPLHWKVVAVVSTVVLAPLAEEVFFRGLVQSMVRRYLLSPWAAILCGSALFAAMHFNQPQAIPSLFALGVAMGYNYERTGRLYAPILMHAIFNALNLALWRPPGA